MWKTLGEIKIPDIVPFVAEASRDGQAVHIGTDSMQSGRFTQFVTVRASRRSSSRRAGPRRMPRTTWSARTGRYRRRSADRS